MSNITLRQLRYLVALADHMHFGRAAEASHVSQPSLSAQVAQMEAELGVKLVERSSRRVLLTPAGVETAARARRILREVQELGDAVLRDRDPLAGTLRLGIIPTIGPYVMPRLLPRVREAYPELKLFLREDLTANLLTRLRNGELDLLMLALPVDEPWVESRALFEDRFRVALPSGHPLGRFNRLEEADLAGQEILLLEDGHCFRDQALAICHRGGAGARHQFAGTSLESLRQMVAGGVGITLLPEIACQDRTPGLTLRDFVPPVPARTVGLAWRRGAPGIAAFRELAEFFARNWADEGDPVVIETVDPSEDRPSLARADQ